MKKGLIEATINLEHTGQTPVAPFIDHFAAKYAGVPVRDFMTNGRKRLNAILKTNNELGPWDALFLGETANFNLLRIGAPLDLEIGEDTHQFREGNYLGPKIYDSLIQTHPFLWMRKLIAQKHPDFQGLSGLLNVAKTFHEMRTQNQLLKSLGLNPATGFTAFPFFEYASLGRGHDAFIYDIVDGNQEKIKKAGKRYTKFITDFSIALSRYIGTPRILIGLARCGPGVSPQYFEEFALPDLEHMINRYVASGITPVLHCDSNWTSRLDYFKRFPARKCILELDGTTDIRKAKEIIGDRMAIMGDVPADILARGSYQDNFNYCRNLIRDIGYNGGFILSSGCSVPSDAKPENVRAMYDAAHK